jgi:hypothetical protein
MNDGRIALYSIHYCGTPIVGYPVDGRCARDPFVVVPTTKASVHEPNHFQLLAVADYLHWESSVGAARLD